MGLANLGCTCYMASCMQQLHMVPSLTAGLLRAHPSEAKRYAPMFEQLQQLLAYLSTSEHVAFEPTAFCSAFRDLDGECLSAWEQRDADEYLHTLFQRLEDDFGQGKLLDRVFGGTLVQQILWEEAAPTTAPVEGGGHPSAPSWAPPALVRETSRSETRESFRVLPLEIEGCATLETALERFVMAEPIRGYQTSAGQTVDAIKRTRLGKLPHTLIVQLKRFRFDYDAMCKLKVFDACAFPPTLRLGPRFLAGGGEGAGGEGAGGEGTGGDGFTYALVGVVVHLGDSENGHYYSYVRERTKGRAGLGLGADPAVNMGCEHGLGADAASATTGQQRAKPAAAGEAAASSGERGAGAVPSTLGRWLLFNDSSVREASEAEACSVEAGSLATPYLLFYERRQEKECPLEPGEQAHVHTPCSQPGEQAAPLPEGTRGTAATSDGGAAAPSASAIGDRTSAEIAGGQWALDEVLADNAALRRRAHVFSTRHLVAVERLLAEQAEAWRAREIAPREALDALVHGFHFTAGTLLHTQRAVGGARLPGVLQALFTLMEEGPAELLEHAIECITERAQPLLRTPLLQCPSDELVGGYADLVHQLVLCAATARASTDALLGLLSALLGLLPEAASLVRRGGVGAVAAHTYVHLLRRLACSRWGRRALEAAASTYELRLLRLHVEEMEEAEEGDDELQRGAADDEASGLA